MGPFPYFLSACYFYRTYILKVLYLGIPLALGPGILTISWSHFDLTFGMWMRWPRCQQRERSRVFSIVFWGANGTEAYGGLGDSELEVERRVTGENGEVE